MPRIPAGWPAEVPPPDSPEFAERVVRWLLDQGPACLRTSDLRAHPLVLATVIEGTVEGQIEGLRRTYSTTRADVRGTPDEPVIEGILAALESAAAGLLQTRREVQAVRVALSSAPAEHAQVVDG